MRLKVILFLIIFLFWFLMASQPIEYKIYFAGEEIGYEKVQLEEKDGRIKLTMEGKLTKPVLLKIKRMEIVYDSSFRPISFIFQGYVNRIKQEIEAEFSDGKVKGRIRVRGRGMPLEGTIPEGTVFVVPSGPVSPFFAIPFAMKKLGLSQLTGFVYVIPQTSLPVVAQEKEGKFIITLSNIKIEAQADYFGFLTRLSIPSQRIEMVRKGAGPAEKEERPSYTIEGPGYFGKEELVESSQEKVVVRKTIPGLSDGTSTWKHLPGKLLFTFDGTILGQKQSYTVEKSAGEIVLKIRDKTFREESMAFVNPDFSLFYLSRFLRYLPQSFQLFIHPKDYDGIVSCTAEMVELSETRKYINLCGLRGYFLFMKGTAIAKAVDALNSEVISLKGMEVEDLKVPVYSYRGKFKEIEVKFPSGKAELAGTLTLPPGNKLPAVIFLTGSGPQDRNENSPGRYGLKLYFFARIAHHLADEGFASLRFDDRGVGKSTGSATRIEDYMQDVRSALDFLKKRPEIDPERIFLLGHSLGAMIALKAATSEEIAGAILLACPCRSGADTILWQLEKTLREGGFPEGYIAHSLRKQKLIFDWLFTGKEHPLIKYEIQRVKPIKEWFREFAAFNPCDLLDKVKVPVLVVQGGKDTQVPPEDAKRMVELLKKQSKDASLAFFPELNHLFLEAETGLVGEYGLLIYTGKTPPEKLYRSIIEWLRRWK